MPLAQPVPSLQCKMQQLEKKGSALVCYCLVDNRKTYLNGPFVGLIQGILAWMNANTTLFDLAPSLLQLQKNKTKKNQSKSKTI